MQEKWKNVRQAAEEGRYEDIPEDVRFLQYKAVEHHRLVGKKRCISEVRVVAPSCTDSKT